MWYLIVSIPDLCTLTYFVMRNTLFSLMHNLKDIFCGHDRKFVMLSIIFWTIYLSKFYRQIIGIPMGTDCAPIVADLLERRHVVSLYDNNQVDVK